MSREPCMNANGTVKRGYRSEARAVSAARRTNHDRHNDMPVMVYVCPKCPALPRRAQRPMSVLAIDPGPKQSAWVILDPDDRVRAHGLLLNEPMLDWIRELDPFLINIGTLVIEKIEAFGMAVGAEVFETVFWTGQFAEAAHPLPVDRVGRKAVKIHLCGSMRAKDPNIRQALIDRFSTRAQPAIGKKAAPGPLFGVAGDVWSALAVAVTWADQHA